MEPANNDTLAAAKTPTDAVPQDVEALKKQLTEKEAECKDFQDKYLRAVAELANERKRFIKDKEEVCFRTLQLACGPIIQIFDHFSMGIESARLQKIPADILKGFEMMLAQFKAQLKSLSIESIDPQNQAFDPHMHEAIAYEYHETVPADHVMKTVKVGYTYNQKLLRPASVIVSKGKAPKQEQEKLA